MSDTALLEAIRSTIKEESGEDRSESAPRLPSYVVASDTLNIANGNKTFIESALDTADSVPKFIMASMISGANQLYNIPADIGNLFGGDFERSATEDVIEDYDSDLGKFYEENKESVDLVGFIASSMVPGMAGVKVLNAGQKSLELAVASGRAGAHTAKAFGWLPNTIKKKALDKAMHEATTNSSVAGILNRNAQKAIAAGAGQNVLEAAAFELAVAGTMFNSPILEDQEIGDLLTNVAFSAGVFGIIGGAMDAAKIGFSLKNAADDAAKAARPWEHIEETSKATKAYEKLALNYEQIDSIPDIPTNVSADRAAFLKQAADSKVEKLNNKIRADLGELTKGDQEVADVLFQQLKSEAVRDQQQAVIGLTEVSRLNVTPKVTKRMEVLAKKISKDKASDKEVAEYLAMNVETGYTKIWGEGAGKLVDEKPLMLSVADTLPKNHRVKVTPTTVSNGKKSWKFSTSPKAPEWNILKVDAVEANARYIWAMDKKGLKPFQPTLKKPISINVNDLPLMEKLLRDLGDQGHRAEGVTLTGLAKNEALGSSLTEFLGKKKLEIANKLVNVRGKKGITQEEIAAITNVKNSLLSGVARREATGTFHASDILAMQSHAEAYTKKLIDQGTLPKDSAPVEIWRVPQTVKLTYDSSPFEALDNFVLENMTIIKQQQKLYAQATNNAADSILGTKWTDQLEPITNGTGGRIYTDAAPSGAGPSAIAAASQNYGTLAASMAQIGKVAANAIEEFKESTKSLLEPYLYKLGQSPEASIEWSVLNQKLRSTPGQYALNEAKDAFEPLVLVRWRKAAIAAQEAGETIPKRPNLPEGMEDLIPIKNEAVRKLAAAHIEVNGLRTAKLAGIRTAQGQQFNRAPEAFYPIPVNPKDFPHFALVSDTSITSGNHHKTLFATNERELESMVAKLKEGNPHLKIRYKDEAEEYFKARGQWDYEQTLNANYLDTAAHRKGVSAPYLPQTDPQRIVDDMMEWHMQRETGLVREAIKAKYEVPFEELRRLGDTYTSAAKSKFANTSGRFAGEKAVVNPFEDYINTALAIKKTERYPAWTNFNRMIDERFSSMFQSIEGVFQNAKTPEELAKINDIMEQAGYKGAAYDESMELFANAKASRGVLTSVVQKANSILATVVLRWDVLNAVNNAVSANVLLGAETKAVLRAIESGDANAAGKLAQLTKVKVPGTDETMFTASKLIHNSVRKFGTNTPEMQWFKENKFVTSISEQYKSTLDGISFGLNDTAKSWDTRLNGIFNKLKKAGDKGEALTGNKLAEEFNRFVAADVMKQLTDIAVDAGVMSPKESLAYINTFVNRTQGNYLASQRPMMFQGPIGQAIGLFQTYQFNLLQQLLRHVGEGHSKDAMTLLGLQASIHGMNGLPAFNAINTHLVGNASGNTQHRDAYDAVYGIAGKEGGDWLMYGAASNALGLLHPDLKINLYTRGDINPRHLTIVPTDPSQVPIVQASARFFGNLFNTAKTLNAGGDVATTLLRGLEHNALSRPLAGLAQTMQGMINPLESSYSTSKRGNIIASNDLMSLANLGRIAGAKPLDEAIALDATYRFKAYGLKDSRRRKVLGQAIKTNMIAGKELTEEQFAEFSESYAKAGGKQSGFTKWVGQLYRTANASEANKIQQNLNSPFNKAMQTIMGGRELRDFSDSTQTSLGAEELSDE